MTPPTDPRIPLAYRNLSKLALRAVKYSSPARHTIRDRLRLAFRKSPPQDFDVGRIRNTAQFLNNAARSQSLERRVLRTILITWYWDPETNPHSRAAEEERKMKRIPGPKNRNLENLRWRREGRDHYYFLIRMLNQSMGMCIR
ncbi:MAG: hypothetical protein M1828_006420 [Chrysothrix sp. TS-e1954]|nr:MAG: hypothetical protein M1828_006420 [Chrysothrix sp. TS-e1954]